MDEPIKCPMIEVCYTRLPGTTNYKGYVRAVVVTIHPGAFRDPVEESQKEITFEDFSMDDIVYTMNEFLQTWRNAKVTVVRPNAVDLMVFRNPKAVELDEQTRDLIRDNLEKAYEMFAPIDQTVKVRDTTIKEREDG